MTLDPKALEAAARSMFENEHSFWEPSEADTLESIWASLRLQYLGHAQAAITAYLSALPAEPVNTQWEYIRFDYSNGATIEVLNELGVLGWELCGRHGAGHTFKRVRAVTTPTTGRDEALEEAAKCCEALTERHQSMMSAALDTIYLLAGEIRALKSTASREGK